MRRIHTPTAGTSDHISLAGRQVEYRLIPSRFATKMRVRVGFAGVEVIRPESRGETEVSDAASARRLGIAVESFKNEAGERAYRIQG